MQRFDVTIRRCLHSYELCGFFAVAGFLHGNKKNVLFSKCAVRECQDTCLNPTNSLGCTGKCKHGCVCAEGLIRNSVGECVLPLNCGKSLIFFVFKIKLLISVEI